MRARSSLVAVSLLMALAAVSPRVRAGDATTIADVRCLVVGMNLMDASDPHIQASGRVAMAYYLGRLDGRSDRPYLESLLIQQAAQMTRADYQAEARRCGERLKARGQQIVTMGEDMERRAQEQKGPSQ